jgi:hypothetical protein
MNAASAGAPGDVASTGQDQPRLPISESDGAFTTAYPIDVPAFHGIEPHLALRYTSSEEIGQLGVGWTIDGLSQIERSSPHFGSPLYGNSDVWRLDGTELVHCASGMVAASCSVNGTFTTRVESYRRILRDNTNNTWTVFDPDGTQYLYRPIANWTTDKTSPIATQYRFLLSTVTDPHGNSVAYDYTCNGPPNCYIYSIIYNGTAIRFYWESRPDTITYATGQVLGQWIWRLHSIDVRVSGSRRRAYAISYTAPGLSSGTGRSLLASIQEYGTDATMDSDGTISGGTALPPAKYLYQSTSGTYDRSDWWSGKVPKLVQGDFNGDGRQDLAWVWGCTVYLELSSGSGFSQTSWPITSCGSSGYVSDPGAPTDYEVGDFDGDGRPDIAVFYGTGLTSSYDYWSVPVLLNKGGRFAELRFANLVYSGVNDGLEFRVGDFNGDGLDDFLVQSKASATPNPADSCFTVYLSTGSQFYAAPQYQASDGCRKRGEVLDINGDGKSDIISFYRYQYNSSSLMGSTGYLVLRSNGTGFDELVGTIQIPCDFSGCGGSWRPSDPTWLRADINGDGKTDLVAVYGQQWTDTDGVVWPPEVAHILPLLSTGSGFVAQPVLANKGRFDAAAGSWVVADLNGDGREDLAVAEPGGSWSGAQHWPQIEAYLSTGTGFDWTYFGSTGWVQGDPNASLFHITASSTPFTGDFSGDGKEDIAWREVDSSEDSWQPIAVFRSISAVPDLMTRVTASLGAMTTIGYTPSSAWANSNTLPSVLQTATSLAVNDGRGHVSTTTVSYGGGLWDKFERRFLGFGWTSVTLPCNSGDNGCPTRVTNYLQSHAGNPAVRTRVFSGAGALLYDRQDTYTHNEDSLPYAALDIDTTVGYDSTGNYAEVQRTFDKFGNITQLTQLGDNSVAGDEVTTVTTYHPDTSDYLVNYPAQIDIYAGASASGTLLASSRYSYDGAAGPGAAPVEGDVTRVQNWLPSGLIASTAEYDGYGNKTAATDPLGNRSEWVYDSTYHLYVTTARDPLFSSDSRHKTTTAWNGICGVPTQTTDMNSLQTNYYYDALCRQTWVAYPDGGFKSTAYVAIGSPTTQYIETDI